MANAELGCTIKSASEGLRKGEFSVEELQAEYLKKIKKENPKLNAYLSVFDGPRPSFAGAKLGRGPSSTLAGIPCAIKDNILIKDAKCTAASKILDNYIAPYNATVIAKLKQTGAVFLGKTNMDEFAMGATGESSAYGPTLNPHDRSRVSGGSSAGSGAAVASDLTIYSLGSDTGGSIRSPASWCGVVGLKPTYGLVSRYGLIAMASSLDQIGTITKTVEDAAVVLNTIAGHDPMDSTSSARDLPDYTSKLNQPIKGMKLAMPREFFGPGLDPQVASAVQTAISKLGSLGAHIDQVSLPLLDQVIATYYIIVPSEVSANLARYDGIRYGYSTHHRSPNLLDVYLQSREEGLGDEVKRRIMLGAYALSSGYYEAYYLKAQKVRTLLKRDFDRVFAKYDAIVGPTMPTLAPRVGELSNPLSNYLADAYTCPVNLAGLPAISVPCGSVDTDGKQLPVGLQIIGKHFAEPTILQIAHNYEQSNL